jgi:GYF domain 2
MSDRSWFFAAQGQQQGPYPEAQLRQFIANGTVTPETLVWTEGMTGWQKAGEIPGLLSGGSMAPAVPQPGGALTSAGGHGGGPLSIELGVWSLFWRSLVFIIGLVLVIPAPWAATSFYRWMVSRVRVPGRPNFGFTGQPGDIWYVFVALGLCTYAGLSGYTYLPLILIPVQALLSWITVRWIAANLSSNGERLPIEFNGSALGYVGWYLLMYISVITIIGWAWVITAWMRWICRNVGGTHREIVFNATGWGMLWRTVLFSLGCGLLIPIPWVLRWYTRWYVSQFALVERTAYANV